MPSSHLILCPLLLLPPNPPSIRVFSKEFSAPQTLQSPLDWKEIQPVHPEGDQSWVFIGSTDAEAETPILWPSHMKSWLIGNTLMLGGIGGRKRRRQQRMRWMASRTRWTWVWVNSGRWWWTGRPGVLRFMGSQRVGHDWATELNWMVLYMVLNCTFRKQLVD